ncbi:hypothetical protein BT67DRAFT_451749 [Trichocladium antarcticum]|uniref:MARVEL domain-containing protein n=1 Tax=Trichocladium antarcticum TaxID=1450529 RepID=A0AAN6UEG0_9PEZI|nr:hypothetical protein BT67DRAFT_451749 [Trichocladium antarcticum]
MIFAIMFALWRFSEIITLIPIMGMLAYFVHTYLAANIMTPTHILVLFIVSVLALAWSVGTLFSYHRSAANARFVAAVDLALVGALIAAVYQLRFAARADCARVVAAPDWRLAVDASCAMRKACFALGIVNCVLFAATAVMAWVHGAHQARSDARREVVVERGGGSSYGRRRSVSAGRSGLRTPSAKSLPYVSTNDWEQPLHFL